MTHSDEAGVKRRFPLRTPPDWDPPVPAWQSTFDEAVEQVSMCVIGFQHAAHPPAETFASALRALAATSTAAVVDIAGGEDGREGDKRRQTLAIFYWYNPQECASWLDDDAYRSYWKKHSQAEDYGVFCELFNIPLHRSETLFSGPEHNHGMSQKRKDVAGPVQRHLYWGGMRDRIPYSAEDSLQAKGSLRLLHQAGSHHRVGAHENLCIIRSGQDWQFAEGEQREDYLQQIEPVLKAGMDFLRIEGAQVGCYCCRYLQEINPDGSAAERSFGLAYFHSIAELEKWAEHHPTHLAIFNKFLQIAPKYGPALQLRLWHEVSVLPPADQWADYVNCAADTGLLGRLSRMT